MGPWAWARLAAGHLIVIVFSFGVREMVGKALPYRGKSGKETAKRRRGSESEAKKDHHLVSRRLEFKRESNIRHTALEQSVSIAAPAREKEK